MRMDGGGRLGGLRLEFGEEGVGRLARFMADGPADRVLADGPAADGEVALRGEAGGWNHDSGGGVGLAVGQGAGAAGVELIGGDALQNEADGELDGGAVLGQGEGGAVSLGGLGPLAGRRVVWW
jgi:hypothetical protein